MGLKSYRLWDTGQHDSNVQSPTAGATPGEGTTRRSRRGRAVALQVEILKGKF
jgi:hypothetical protein